MKGLYEGAKIRTQVVPLKSASSELICCCSLTNELTPAPTTLPLVHVMSSYLLSIYLSVRRCVCCCGRGRDVRVFPEESTHTRAQGSQGEHLTGINNTMGQSLRAAEVEH